MLKRLSPLAIAGALVSQTGFVEAETALNALVTYVSSNGTDGGICDNPSSPCRTFQYALNHTIIYGEVKALDAADYGPISIDFAVNISGVEGARVIHPTGGPAINLERGAAPVSLTHLTVMGPYPRTPQRSPAVGIVINQGPITITHCTIQYFRTGIDIFTTSGFLIADLLVSDTFDGVKVSAGQYGSSGVLDHVRLHGNFGTGLTIGAASDVGPTQVTAVEITASDNGSAGISVQRGGLKLAHSTITGNGHGIEIASPDGDVASFADNYISGNGQDVYGGSLTHVGTQ